MNYQIPKTATFKITALCLKCKDTALATFTAIDPDYVAALEAEHQRLRKAVEHLTVIQKHQCQCCGLNHGGDCDCLEEL